jgi:hypothetical protein
MKRQDILEIPPDEEFKGWVTNYLQEYMETGFVSDEKLAPAIYNIGDEAIASRKIVFRAGDYITLRTEYRERFGR